ncbi:YciI family protein [uncultured Helicobacter sp.]|uniref:YciI family protein n=1 Tax=uncultured Helicobacter sp. TaxID=175537 RepID=UPI0025D6CDA3|nr:YciI family protein [uncultured Helicobacter sp.]
MPQLFVCLVHYTQPFEEILKRLDEHRTYLKMGYEKGFLLASGPRIPKDGGIIIGKFASKDEAITFSQNDPFTRHNLAQYEILTFEVVLHAEILKDFLQD